MSGKFVGGERHKIMPVGGVLENTWKHKIIMVSPEGI